MFETNSEIKLKQIWLKAAIIGSIWAAFEIIIGSFLHNLRIPFSGTFMSAASVFIIISFTQIWNDRWLIIRAGIICALMKSISPSSVIFGPMIGILSEAVFIELFSMLFGRNILGYAIGGAVAVLSSLFQKVFNWLLMYGFDLVSITEELYKYFQKQLHFSLSLETMVYGAMLFYIILGISAAIFGVFIGKNYKKKDKRPFSNLTLSIENNNNFTLNDSANHLNPWLNILVLLFSLVLTMIALNAKSNVLAFGGGIIFPIILIFRYKKSLKRLSKPEIWLQFLVITLLATIFWEFLKTGNYFSIHGLLIGLRMNLRAIVVILSFSALSVELKNPIVKVLLYKKGFSNLYKAVNLSFSILPSIIEMLPRKRFSVKKSINLVEIMLNQAENLLENFSQNKNEKPSIIVITGEKNQGKTTFTKQLISMLQNKGIQVEGLLTVAHYENNAPIAYSILDIKSEVEMELCSIHEKVATSKFGKFFFDENSIEIGNKFLRNTSQNSIVVIDEIGKLELERESGWFPSMNALIQGQQNMHIWVIRKAFIPLLDKKYTVPYILIDIKESTIEQVYELILSKQA